MPDSEQRNDIDRVGLSDKSRAILDEIMADSVFKDGVDAYRLAAALAIKHGVDISEHTVKRQNHIYLQSQIDPNQIFGEVITAKFPQFKDQKYRSLEKFADLGMVLLKDLIDQKGGLEFWEAE